MIVLRITVTNIIFGYSDRWKSESWGIFSVKFGNMENRH